MITLLFIFNQLLRAQGIPAHLRCLGKSEIDGKSTVEFEVNRQGLVEGVGYGSEVVSINRIAKRAVIPPYRFQTVGATELNDCQSDPFGDRYLFKFQMGEATESDRAYSHVHLSVECTDGPVLHVEARCEPTSK